MKTLLIILLLTTSVHAGIDFTGSSKQRAALQQKIQEMQRIIMEMRIQLLKGMQRGEAINFFPYTEKLRKEAKDMPDLYKEMLYKDLTSLQTASKPEALILLTRIQENAYIHQIGTDVYGGSVPVH